MLEGTDSTGNVFEGHRDASANKGSLQDRLQNRSGEPFSLEETFTVITQLGRALAYAHECDVTYGNLKPENILFNKKGNVLLADFFLHALAKQSDNTIASEDSAYRAPELPPSRASKLGDQYALGCIAYEMLTGHKPFLISSISKPGVFYRTKTPISLKHFTPAIPPRSDEAILKAIAKDPTQRHRDIRCFLTALGIPTDTGDQVTSREAVSLPLVSDPPEQTHPLQTPVRYATEEAETLSTPALTVYSYQPAFSDANPTHPLAVAADLVSASDPTRPLAVAADLVSASGPTRPLAVAADLASASGQTNVSAKAEESPPSKTSKSFTVLMDTFQPHTLADSLLHSPAQYPFAYNLSADAEPLSADSTKRFFQRRWVAVVITCLIAICIVATSFLALSIPRSAQGNKTIPAIDTKIDPTPEHPTTSASSTPTPRVTATPEPSPTVEPSPTSRPTATIQPTPTPTPKHGHH